MVQRAKSVRFGTLVKAGMGGGKEFGRSESMVACMDQDVRFTRPKRASTRSEPQKRTTAQIACPSATPAASCMLIPSVPSIWLISPGRMPRCCVCLHETEQW